MIKNIKKFIDTLVSNILCLSKAKQSKAKQSKAKQSKQTYIMSMEGGAV